MLFTLISALTALAAVLAGPFVARLQISEAQINALQDDLSEVFAILTPIPPATLWDEINAEKRSRVLLLMNRIRLRLPEDEASEELLRVIRQLLEISLMEREQALKRAFSKSHEILSGMRAGLLRRYKKSVWALLRSKR